MERLFLSSVAPRGGSLHGSGFPFDLRVLRHLGRVEFTTPVTFLVGENGSGKSTLLEAIAAALGLPAVGSEETDRDDTLEPARRLADSLVLTRPRIPHRGCFFRAEDAFGFTKRISALIRELREEGAEEEEALLIERYGADPDARSHGEWFLHLVQLRCVPGGLHLLDEPETPLSPVRQLALLSLLRARVAEGTQFVIATHSPILMALPGARILEFTDDGVGEVEWEDVEHVAVTRAFLQNPDAYLRHL